jgi:hypothetical protein
MRIEVQTNPVKVIETVVATAVDVVEDAIETVVEAGSAAAEYIEDKLKNAIEDDKEDSISECKYSKYVFVDEVDDTDFEVIANDKLDNTVDSIIKPVYKVQLIRRKNIIEISAIKSMISAETGTKIMYYNAQQLALRNLEKLDEQLATLNKDFKLFTFVNKYMDAVEEFKMYLSGKTRRNLILSHMKNSGHIYYENQTLDELFDMTLDIIEGSLLLKRGSFKTNYNNSTSCFFKTKEQKKKIAAEKTQKKIIKEHNKKVAKRQFKGEDDAVIFQ